jgi:four helix bundle protein
MQEDAMERHYFSGTEALMRDFRTLQVWQKAHQMTLTVYKATAHFPREEAYGLVSQIRRAAVSIPMNIAEGCGRDGDAELARFMQIAMGSASELEYGIVLAHDLGLLSQDEHGQLSEASVEIKRMLASLIRKLRADS